MNIVQRISNFITILKSRTVHVKTLERSRWYDSDELLLHVSFQVLNDFVEDECFRMIKVNRREEPCTPANRVKLGFEYIDSCISNEQHYPTAFSKDRIDGYNEIKFLYTWWNVDRFDRVDTYCHDVDTNKQEDEEMLVRLVKVCKYMWS